MATYTANSAAVGTALVAAAGTITGITMAQPTSTTDMTTPLVLLDQAAAPANAAATAVQPPVLFADSAGGLMPGWKPGIAFTPGLTAPTWPIPLNTKANFSKGIFVQSCPANATFTITA